MNILLIQLKRIGDLVLTTPVIEAIRQKFPDAKITLVVSRECAGLVPAIPGIGQTLIVRRGFSDLDIFLKVARTKFDYCIDFTQNNRSALLAFLSRARKRVASGRIRRRSRLRRSAYNEFVRHRMRDMHTIDHNLALLEPLGIREVSPPVSLTLPPNAHEKANALRKHSNIKEAFVIFHPGSARVEKFWETDRWAEAIMHAVVQWNVTAVLTGGSSPQEKAHLAEIESKLPPPTGNAPAPVVDLSGKIDLLTFAALIQNARLLVTVDTAPMHLAGAMRTPQVILFGPTNPFHWRPRTSPAIILQGESGIPVHDFAPAQPRLSTKLISTRAVIDAMDSLLSIPTSHAL